MNFRGKISKAVPFAGGSLSIMLLLAMLLAACSGRNETPIIADPESSQTLETLSPSPSNPIETQQAEPSFAPPKEDNSVRAIGESPDGRLLVRPVSTATVAPLGAPSCYGLETYLEWKGAYEAVWEPSKGEWFSIRVFPSDFMLIRPDDTPAEMQKVTIGDTDLFVYVPRVTDCHALETYLFGVRQGEAFPVDFEMEDGRTLMDIGQLPGRPPEFKDGEMTVWGGYGAGDDTIDEYHFRYDEKKRIMVLQSTEYVKP